MLTVLRYQIFHISYSAESFCNRKNDQEISTLSVKNSRVKLSSSISEPKLQQLVIQSDLIFSQYYLQFSMLGTDSRN